MLYEVITKDLFDGRSAPEKSEIRAAITTLNEEYESRGIVISEVASVITSYSIHYTKLYEVGDAQGISVGDTAGISVGDATGISVGDTAGISVGDLTGISVGDTAGIRNNFV